MSGSEKLCSGGYDIEAVNILLNKHLKYSKSLSKGMIHPHSVSDTVGGNLFRAYEALARNGMVKSEELTALEAWFTDISEII